ncbi:hypothetical protein DH2020_029836 [Rehmannia glutinosa]|uniref:Uncharacterized protein n=1 Tax=Rehmannia glutinosa TaxID=99300 RepID=A0ABR0VMD9_REHGL
MWKKSKGVVLDSSSRFGVGVYEDAKARMRHQDLMKDYEELQRETDATRSKLDAANQRKLMLAAEVRLYVGVTVRQMYVCLQFQINDQDCGCFSVVISSVRLIDSGRTYCRFLRKRYKYLVETKNMNSSHEQNLAKAPNSVKQTKIIRNEASQHRLPLLSEPKKKKHYIVEQVARRDASPITDHAHKKILYGGKEATRRSLAPISTPFSDLNQKGKKRIRKEAVATNMTLLLDKNQKERMLCANDAAALRNFPTAAFDLNQDCGPSGKEASLPIRAPKFDLNEISVGDEDFQINVEVVKFEEAKKSLIRGISDEQQNDLKLAVCRNSGEGSSRAGKRKISWQDPVALRV